MALQRHASPSGQIEVLIGNDAIFLSCLTIKSYLPNLWRLHGRKMLAKGYYHPERDLINHGPNISNALLIIFDALEAFQAQSGAATELRLRLNRMKEINRAYEKDPERVTAMTFCNVARLFDPNQAFGHRQEIAFAMSEWFVQLAATENLLPATMLRCISALDHLHADISAPLNAFLKSYSISSVELRELSNTRWVRPKTMRLFRALWREYRGTAGPSGNIAASTRPPNILGGDLDIRDIIQQWHRDPDSIKIDLRPKRRRHDAIYDDDSAYSTYDELDYSDRDCSCNLAPLDYHDRLLHPPMLAPPRWLSPLHEPRRQIPMIMPPSRLPSPLPSVVERPILRRHQTFPPHMLPPS
ncbi:MAG: hypothetical protein Q9219_000734 [cf. Caloplaca sp. 3 TL-2023]